jgi:hypothetical protein
MRTLFLVVAVTLLWSGSATACEPVRLYEQVRSFAFDFDKKVEANRANRTRVGAM